MSPRFFGNGNTEFFRRVSQIAPDESDFDLTGAEAVKKHTLDYLFVTHALARVSSRSISCCLRLVAPLLRSRFAMGTSTLQ